MINIISHRGNLDGVISNEENNPEYVLEALRKDFDVEVDVWLYGGYLFLGHDAPKFKISTDFLKNDRIWCHAKNVESLEFMIKNNLNCFWHESDKFTITSKKFLWCYYDNYHPLGITVLKENKFNDVKIPDNILGICTDFPKKWREKFVKNLHNI
jgi:hypothetical protein